MWKIMFAEDQMTTYWAPLEMLLVKKIPNLGLKLLKRGICWSGCESDQREHAAWVSKGEMHVGLASPTPKTCTMGRSKCKKHKWGSFVACLCYSWWESHMCNTHTHTSHLPELGSQLYPQFPGFRTLQGSSHHATCCYLGPQRSSN
jgi:hypothetical protein